MEEPDAAKPSRRAFLTAAGATTAATVLAGNSIANAQEDAEKTTPKGKSRRTRIFDGHTHMLLDSDEKGLKRRSAADLKEINLPNLFARMDELGIEKMVLVIQETQRIWKEWLGTNEMIIDLQTKYPDRFIGVYGAEPLTTDNVLNRERLEAFERAVKDHGIKGLWFGPPYCHFEANDRRVYPFYEVAVDLDVVVYFHHGGGIGGGGGPARRAPLKYARAINLDDVVIDFPKIRINVEHMAYPWTEELFAIIKHSANMYTDVCELFYRPQILAWYLMMAKEYDVIDRVIWGSDYDVFWYDDYDFSGYIKKVQGETGWLQTELNKICERSGWPTLTDEEIDGVVGGNARRLWKLAD